MAQDHKLTYEDPNRVRISIPESSTAEQIDAVRFMNQDILEFFAEQQVVDSNLRTNQLLIEKGMVDSRAKATGVFWYLLFGAPLLGLVIYWRMHRASHQVVTTSPFPTRTASEFPNNVVYILPTEQAFRQHDPVVTPYREALPVEQSLAERS
jgi:hypothetical protein